MTRAASIAREASEGTRVSEVQIVDIRARLHVLKKKDIAVKILNFRFSVEFFSIFGIF